MSKSGDQRINRWENLLADIQQVSLVSEGCPVSDRDRKTITTAYVIWALLLTDLDLLGDDAAVRLVRRLSRADVHSVMSTLKSLDRVLLGHWLTKEAIVTIARFKREAELPWLVNAFFPVLFQYCQSATTVSFRRLHQAFSFLSRVSMRDYDESRGMQEFIERNNQNPQRQIDYSIALELSTIFEGWFSGFEMCPWGKHGPGSTMDHGRCSPFEKSDFYHDFCFSPDMRDAFGSIGLDIFDYYPVSSYLAFDYDKVCKLHIVPKNALKQRTIALERVGMQYFQQIIRVSLYKWIDENIHQIPLYRQEKNRALAREGSISGYYSTIDLSAASDSVDRRFVEIAFSRTTLAPWLAAAGTTAVEIQGKRYPLNMYATMGSAICFPIESLVFAGICELATRIVGRKLNYSVYGDDIIAPQPITNIVIELLERSGFTVNKDKTFSGHFPLCFRESCGGEYLRGEEVTPIRIPRQFAALKDKGRSPGTFLSWIQLANRLFSIGALNARRFVLRRLLDSPPYPVFGNGEHQLHTYDPTNYLLKHRWNVRLQRAEVLGAAVRTRPEEPSLIGGDDILYWDWWRQKGLEEFCSIEPLFESDPSYGTATRVENAWQCVD